MSRKKSQSPEEIWCYIPYHEPFMIHMDQQQLALALLLLRILSLPHDASSTTININIEDDIDTINYD